MKVNEKRRGRPSKDQSELGKDNIIKAAKRLMEINGSIPSIRGLAQELDVDAMAIYYYFKNKNELLEAITTSLISDIYCPTDSTDWQLELLTLCKSYLYSLDQYDGLLETLLTMQTSSPANIFTDRFLHIIQPLQLTEFNENNLLNLLVDYIHGFSLAKSCDKSKTLAIDDIEQPVKLICKAAIS
jgi:AcrR family transcriptional regulator